MPCLSVAYVSVKVWINNKTTSELSTRRKGQLVPKRYRGLSRHGARANDTCCDVFRHIARVCVNWSTLPTATDCALSVENSWLRYCRLTLSLDKSSHKKGIGKLIERDRISTLPCISLLEANVPHLDTLGLESEIVHSMCLAGRQAVDKRMLGSSKKKTCKRVSPAQAAKKNFLNQNSSSCYKATLDEIWHQ